MTQPADKTSAEILAVEGLAAQLYTNDRQGRGVWWHVAREDLKDEYRKRAAAQIADFHRDNPHPGDAT